MKFTLIYDGPLPAGKSKRSEYAAKVRNRLHPQLSDLWDNHVILRQLARTARTAPLHLGGGFFGGGPPKFSSPNLPEYNEPIPPLMNGQTDLCAPLQARGGNVTNLEHTFLPIVRRSLYLACQLDILFLRHEEPDHLLDGGDLDNRIKCFFDGLTVPDTDQLRAGESPQVSPLCCLLENDRLISDFSIRTGRLLGKDEKHPHDVRIQVDVTVKVLRVFPQNECLVGG
jgi:hypothetical protein